MGINYNPRCVQDGLVLYLDAANTRSYPKSGNTWNDISGNNNATLTNGPTFNSQNGGNFIFDGTNDYAVTSSTNFSANNDFTYEVLVKASQYITGRGILSNKEYWTTGQGATISHISSPQTIYGYITTSAGHFDINSTITAPYEWTHVVMRRLNNDLRFFINGNYLGTTRTISGTVTDSSDKFWIASVKDGASSYQGNIAIARVYNKALSSLEIQQNFNTTRSRFGI